MVVLNREQHKKDFGKTMGIMDFEPEDTVHKLLMDLTINAKRSVMSILNMDRQDLKDLSGKDAEGNTLSFDNWEVSEIISIPRCVKMHRTEKGDDFHLVDLDKEPFEDFNISTS